MTAPTVGTAPGEYRLEDQLGATAGRVTMSGVHALLRAPLDTVRADAARGRRTSGVVCGYRGSPLGIVDTTYEAHEAELLAHDVRFVNGVNEDLAATVIWGTQQTQRDPACTVDGVIGLWYGKAPGLDRSGDALRHASLSGVPSTGGVVAAVGDDPECKSSTVPSQPEWALADLVMPALAPATVQDVLDLGRHGYEISRRCGSWVGLKIHTDVADGYATVELGRPIPDVPRYERDGRPWSALLDDRLYAPFSIALEEDAVGPRLDAVHHYVRHAGIDVVHGTGPARIGILTAGKTATDVWTALGELGIEPDDLAGLGIRILVPALVWPLEPDVVRRFADGLDEIVVVEEKRAFLEDQVRALLYGTTGAPAIHGKRDADGSPLVPNGGVVDVRAAVEALRRRLVHSVDPARLRAPRAHIDVVTDLPPRTPYFCSGCPHNRSTEVPEGSIAGGGIGCHGMAQFTRGRASGATHMGGEGAQWVGASMFSPETHRFQNMGDGTLAHSGILAIRQAVATGTNITFKILANGVVAMTGGQHAAGALSVPALTRQLEAEGVVRIDVVTDDPKQYGHAPRFARDVKVHDRKELDRVQRELREVPGVTALIYDQACAADLRRERKRGRAPTPTARVMINEAVCEGCGDCGVVSNCLSVHPVETPFGRKTRIHQDSCNLDTSCVEGDCPAFVSVIPLRRRAARRDRGGAVPPVPPESPTEPPTEPPRPAASALLVAGIGGTGVVTVGQILSTAANLDGLDVSSVDQTGMAQKGGPVVSHLRIGAAAHEGAARLEEGRADGYLVFDLLTGVSPANLARLDRDRTRAVVSTAQVPTGAMVSDVGMEHFPDLDRLREQLDALTRDQVYVDAEAVALHRFGSQPAANLVVVGIAYQRGLLPPSAASIERAIELNGVAVETNVAAFRLGRAIAIDPARAEVDDPTAPPALSDEAQALCARVDADAELATVLAWRVPELIAYQDADYAARFVDVVARARTAEVAAGSTDSAFSCTVARNLFHLLAYKDEYEVARLHRDPRFRAAVEAEFGEGAQVTYLLQPPAATRLGLTRKIRVRPSAARPMFWSLARLKRLRGTRLDPFGRSEERRSERRLVDEYVDLVDDLARHLGTDAAADALAAAGLVDMVRGYAAVKERNLERYRRELDAALARLP